MPIYGNDCLKAELLRVFIESETIYAINEDPFTKRSEIGIRDHLSLTPIFIITPSSAYAIIL